MGTNFLYILNPIFKNKNKTGTTSSILTLMSFKEKKVNSEIIFIQGEEKTQESKEKNKKRKGEKNLYLNDFIRKTFLSPIPLFIF